MAETINTIKDDTNGDNVSTADKGIFGEPDAPEEGLIKEAKDKTEQLKQKMRRLLGDDI